MGEFLSLDIPVREMVLAPVLPAQGLAMLYSNGRHSTRTLSAGRSRLLMPVR